MDMIAGGANRSHPHLIDRARGPGEIAVNCQSANGIAWRYGATDLAGVVERRLLLIRTLRRRASTVLAHNHVDLGNPHRASKAAVVIRDDACAVHAASRCRIACLRKSEAGTAERDGAIHCRRARPQSRHGHSDRARRR